MLLSCDCKAIIKISIVLILHFLGGIMDNITVGLFNDSFPPTIDGVANVVVNYAISIQKKYGNVVVATPRYPDVIDQYPFDVIRYPSVHVSKKIGYRAGYPFNSKIIEILMKKKIDIIHTHSPFTSAVLARVLRHYTGAPIVLTYHTKFDIDIDKRVAFNSLRKVSLKFLLSNINACDEVWVVSEGAGENLRKIGYKGDYILMENGVDYQRGKSPVNDMEILRQKHGLDGHCPVFLFVGRLMWYKGIRLTLDALKIMTDQKQEFRMIFVGSGMDSEEIMEYARELKLDDRCIFTGPIYNRDNLKTYYSIADLFIFPSTFDTNGIVIREAASCYCPSLLIRGSAAAEGIIHEETGLLTDEDEVSIAKEILKSCKDLEKLRTIGLKAGDTIYLSWDDAVEKAYERYRFILGNLEEKELKLSQGTLIGKNDKLVKNRFFRGRKN